MTSVRLTDMYTNTPAQVLIFRTPFDPVAHLHCLVQEQLRTIMSYMQYADVTLYSLQRQSKCGDCFTGYWNVDLNP